MPKPLLDHPVIEEALQAALNDLYVPLHMDIRENSDAGTPVVISQPDGPHAAAYRKIALDVAARLFPETDED